MTQKVLARLRSIRTVPAKRLAIAGVVATVCLVAILLLILVPRFNNPTEGTIIHSVKTTENSMTEKTLTTPYYEMTYPTNYQLQSKHLASASLDARILIGHPSGGAGISNTLALTVINLPAGGVTEDSSYMLYKTHPAEYTLSQEVIGADTLVVATKATPNYEKSYLWPHGKYLLTIVMSTTEQSPGIDQELTQMMQGVHWIESQ